MVSPVQLLNGLTDDLEPSMESIQNDNIEDSYEEIADTIIPIVDEIQEEIEPSSE